MKFCGLFVLVLLMAWPARTADPMELMQLAHERERKGEFARALTTWDWLKKQHGNQKPFPSASGSNTWSQIADFWMHRLKRKQNLAARKPQPPNSQERDRLMQARQAANLLEREGQIEFLVEADMDGDFVDEIFFVGKYGPLGKRTEPFFGLATLRGGRFEVVWRAPREMRPFQFRMEDQDADGWKEVFLGFTPDSDDAATLYFNGRAVLVM